MKLMLKVMAAMIILCSILIAQSKKPLDHSVYADWKTIQSSKISNDGKWSVYLVNPARGDENLYLVNLDNGKKEIFQRGKDPVFSYNSGLLVFRVTPEFNKIRALKIAKKKDDDLPKDTLYVKNLKTGDILKYADCKTFVMPEKSSDWLAVHFEKEKPAKNDTAKTKTKSKIKKERTKLLVLNAAEKKEFWFENVSEFSISKSGNLFSFISQVKDSLDSCSVYIFDTKLAKAEKTFYQKGFVKNPVTDNQGTQAAFLFSTDTASVKNYNLYYWDNKTRKTGLLIDSLDKSMNKFFTVSPFRKAYFSENDSKLYFGTAPRLRVDPKDTLLAEEKATLDLWSWTDPLLQPQQLKDLKREKEKNYLAFYNFSQSKMIQLANENIENISTFLKADADYYLGRDNKEYDKLVSWDQRYSDYYYIDTKTNKTKLLQKKLASSAELSPDGKYFVWYNSNDSCWYSMDVQTDKIQNLTKNIKSEFYNKLHDTPDDPSPMGLAGFTKSGSKVLIYDNYDIWGIDLTGKTPVVSVTNGFGKKNKIQFRYVKLDQEEEFIDLNSPLLLSCFDETTKQNGFYSLNKNSLKMIIKDNYSYPFIAKAKDAGKLIWRKGNFNEYSDLYFSGTDFTNPLLISDANPQQKNYLWGSVELIKWKSGQGVELDGLVYVPENFNPHKKYPMIVYFYERDSQTMFNHYIPSPSRSIINIPYFVSNGYVVFVPDIAYKTGYPGQSAYDAIVTGTLAVLEKGFVDEKAVGIQGQSWGGYQVAYLVTKTNMFAAAGAGAPVSNMTSAYGGIRWESGMSRMFQYEKTQSRIGGTLWEKPFQYIENSPVFFAQNVNTPLFMTHNDNDGAVPWYQGIEYFTALRRLNKPVWMVNYNGDSHNLKAESWGNRVDLSIRLSQFFDHYLKKSPMPDWMKNGIPAIEKGKTLGY